MSAAEGVPEPVTPSRRRVELTLAIFASVTALVAAAISTATAIGVSSAERLSAQQQVERAERKEAYVGFTSAIVKLGVLAECPTRDEPQQVEALYDEFVDSAAVLTLVGASDLQPLYEGISEQAIELVEAYREAFTGPNPTGCEAYRQAAEEPLSNVALGLRQFALDARDDLEVK